MSFYFLFSIFFFLFGLAIGSFLNCVIYRLYKKESFLRSFSYCPHCKHKLNYRDLIPVLSFIILRGRCRYCQQKISLQYPLVEIATGLLFLLIFQNLHGLHPCYIFYLLVVSCFLIIIFVYDLKHYIIPDKIIYPAIMVSGIWYLVASIFFKFYTKHQILNAIYSALGAAAFFFLIFLISRGKWLGFGDVKLALFMGLFLGFPNILVAFFLASLIGAIIGIGLIISGKKKLSSEVPFGPFLISGTFLALFWGENLINWYLNLFL